MDVNFKVVASIMCVQVRQNVEETYVLVSHLLTNLRHLVSCDKMNQHLVNQPLIVTSFTKSCLSVYSEHTSRLRLELSFSNQKNKLQKPFFFFVTIILQFFKCNILVRVKRHRNSPNCPTSSLSVCKQGHGNSSILVEPRGG